MHTFLLFYGTGQPFRRCEQNREAILGGTFFYTLVGLCWQWQETQSEMIVPCQASNTDSSAWSWFGGWKPPPLLQPVDFSPAPSWPPLCCVTSLSLASTSSLGQTGIDVYVQQILPKLRTDQVHKQDFEYFKYFALLCKGLVMFLQQAACFTVALKAQGRCNKMEKTRFCYLSADGNLNRWRCVTAKGWL